MRAAGWTVWVAGVVVALVAGVVAPQQPEVFHGGGACQLAPCGELEDPPLWRAMWGVWSVGAALVVLGTGLVVAALPGGGWPRPVLWRWAVAVAAGVALWFAALAAVFLSGLLGSAQLAAAVLLLGVPLTVALVLLTLLGGQPAGRRALLVAAALSLPVPLLVASMLTRSLA